MNLYRRASLASRLSGALLLSLTLAACGGGSKKHPDEGPDTPPAGTVPETLNVSFSGLPAEIEEGESATLTVTANQRQPDGTETTATPLDASWSYDPQRLQIANNELTALSAGTSNVAATWDTVSSSTQTISVLCKINKLALAWPTDNKMLLDTVHSLNLKGECADGSQRALDPAHLRITSTNPGAVKIEGTDLKAVSASKATVNVSYKALRASANISVEKPVVPVSLDASVSPTQVCLGDASAKIAASLLKSDNSREDVSQTVSYSFKNPSNMLSSAFNVPGDWKANVCLNTLCDEVTVKVSVCVLTVYVKTPATWKTPYIFAQQNGNSITSPQPGDPLSPAGDGWYLRDFEPGSYQVTFSDGKDKKSNPITLDKTGWCELLADGNCNWLNSDPRTAKAPVIDIQPRGKAFRNSLDVKIAWSGDENATCRYTLDGSDAKTSPLASACHNRSSLTLGANAKSGDKITLNVCVSNTLGSPCDKQVYTKTDAAEFSWDNATVYFVLTDRFNNGSPSNDYSYGRKRDGQDDIGTWQGGDVKGLIEKLQPESDGKSYFQKLGINAIWISSPVEQMHGWVPGGNGKFQHYAYHGYYPKDFTKLDANLGTPDEFKSFVDLAHSQGIRIVMDVVMNHTGYYATQDLSEDGMSAALAANWKNATLDNYFSMINFNSNAFANGWGPQWIRAGLPGHTSVGPDKPGCMKIDDCPETANLFFLPDLKTEAPELVGLPPFLAARAAKGETGAKALPQATVRDYLTDWLSSWVATYGVDGFRVDTIKHVEVASWELLKKKSVAALRQWKANNPDKKLDDLDFWMTGEYWRHGPSKVAPNGAVYLHHGFDSVINFEFQYAARDNLNNPAGIDATYAKYAKQVNTDDELETLSYISSHDRGLLLGLDPPDIATNPTGVRVPKKTAGTNNDAQKKAGTLLLMAPGGVQIYYGDETARADGAYYDTDPAQASRSFMNWNDVSSGLVSDVLTHWQKLGQFRQQHLAIGAGLHKQLAASPYTFSRVHGEDKVVVAIGAKGKTDINMAGVFADGTVLKDHYTGATTTVSAGKASVTAHANGVILLAP